MAQLAAVPVALGFVWTSTSVAGRVTAGDGAQLKCIWQLESEHSRMSKWDLTERPRLTEVSFMMWCESDAVALTKTKTSGTPRQVGQKRCAVRSDRDSDISTG